MRAIAKFGVVFFSLLGLVACGGGGEISRDGDTNTGSGGGTTEVTYTINLSLLDAQGATLGSNPSLSSSTPMTVQAVLQASDGSSVEGKIISFSFDQDGLAEFTVANARAVTDASGVATIGLTVGETSGAVSVIAAYDSSATQNIALTSEGLTTQSEQPATLNLYASSLLLPSSGADQIAITAVVKNAENILMENVEVRFSVNNDAALLTGAQLTDESGIARTTLTTGEKPENRTVIVTASAGVANPIVEQIEIQIVGTEIVIDGPSSIIVNDQTEITINVQDSDGNPIGGQTIALSTELGTVSNQAPVSGETGQIIVQYESASSGTETITAQALNASASFNIEVGEDLFYFSQRPAQDVNINADEQLTVTWLKDGSPYAGGTVSFVSSRGTITAADTVTDASGTASFTISSSSAGRASISAVGVDADGDEVSARTEFEFIATTANSIVVDASPDSIGPAGQQSTITAVVRDSSGNLVKGTKVKFSLNDVSGGSISPSEATTDGTGSASTVYTSLGTSSLDGVIITATVVDDETVTNTTTMTVSDRAFDISFGTGTTIEQPTFSTNRKEFDVFVADSSGNPVSNVELSVSLTPLANPNTAYIKGFTSWNDTDNIWEFFETAYCQSEDSNGNGLLDEELNEDINGDGELTPGVIGVVYFQDNSAVTDDSGRATLIYDYPINVSFWAVMQITVKATSAGTESSATTRYRLAPAAVDTTTESRKAPESPWGSSASCTDTL